MIGAVLQEYVSYVVELLQYRSVEKQYSNVLIIPGCKFVHVHTVQYILKAVI